MGFWLLKAVCNNDISMTRGARGVPHLDHPTWQFRRLSPPLLLLPPRSDPPTSMQPLFAPACFLSHDTPDLLAYRLTISPNVYLIVRIRGHC